MKPIFRRLFAAVIGGAGGAFVGAYDAIPNLAHVYEPARRALSAYTGALLRLRRDSDNAESDFGYVASTGELDTAAITAWLAGSSGYIETIYDQKGTDNLTQATAANQPLYVASVQNGHAGMYFDGLASYYQIAFAAALSQPFHIYAVAKLDADAVNDGIGRRLVASNNVGTRTELYSYAAVNPDAWAIFAGATLAYNNSDSNPNLWAALFNGASSQLRINNTTLASGNAGANNPGGITLGTSHDLAQFWKGHVCALVIADPSHSDAERAATETALNAYWDCF